VPVGPHALARWRTLARIDSPTADLERIANMTAEEIWRAKNDEALLVAAKQLSEYTEAGQAIILAELDRRHLIRPDLETSPTPTIGEPNRMTAESDNTTLRTAKLTALFCSVAATFYSIVQVKPSPIVRTFFSAGPLLAVLVWIQQDAARTGVGSVHDLGLFLWFAWPVIIPWYAWKTRGRAGWRLLFMLFGLIGSAYISGIVVSWLAYLLGA
jgi:hypothetical protein